MPPKSKGILSSQHLFPSTDLSKGDGEKWTEKVYSAKLLQVKPTPILYAGQLKSAVHAAHRIATCGYKF